MAWDGQGGSSPGWGELSYQFQFSNSQFICVYPELKTLKVWVIEDLLYSV